jgi:hypothetical protein
MNKNFERKFLCSQAVEWFDWDLFVDTLKVAVLHFSFEVGLVLLFITEDKRARGEDVKGYRVVRDLD